MKNHVLKLIGIVVTIAFPSLLAAHEGHHDAARLAEAIGADCAAERSIESPGDDEAIAELKKGYARVSSRSATSSNLDGCWLKMAATAAGRRCSMRRPTLLGA